MKESKMSDIQNVADMNDKHNNSTTEATTNTESSSSLHDIINIPDETIYIDGIRKTSAKPFSTKFKEPDEDPNELAINIVELEKAGYKLEFPDKIEIINTRALPGHAKTYQLEEFKKNAMIIFNFVNLDGYKPRIGTKEDEKALRETFSQFYFEIEPPHHDLTKVEMFDALKKFSEKDFTEYGCVVIVVMTHGERDGLLRAKEVGQLYSEQDIINHFKTDKKPTLRTKPVILIIQACRGKAYSKSVAVMQSAGIYRDHEEQFIPYNLPVESDRLIFHSSYIGNVSFRTGVGSWLIQTMCKKVNKLYRTHDLLSIFTEVQRKIAVDKYYMELNRDTDEMDVHKQMPVVTSTLIRKLYLQKMNDVIFKHVLKTCSSRTTRSEFSTNLDLSQTDGEDTTCCCYIEHFSYLKTCLSHMIKNNPKDEVAKSLLQLSESETEGDDVKTKSVLILISNYLQKHYMSSEHHKYIHFYVSGCAIDLELQPTKNSTKLWGYSTPNKFVVSVGAVGTCVGAYVAYTLLK